MPVSAPSPTSAVITPSLRALFIQVAAAIAVGVTLLCLKRISGVGSSLAIFAILTGIVAAVFSQWHRLTWWWIPIQLFFTPGLLAVNALSIPPTAFLIIFVLLLGVFWSTFRTQVPLFLSGPAVWDAVEALLPVKPVRCVDIGSGIGGLILALSARRRDCEFVGVEIAPLPWLISAIRGRMRNSAARFTRRDYRTLDLAEFDVVFAYLSPAAMPAVWQQAQTQMRKEAMLISYAFDLADITPDQIYEPRAGGLQLFVWFPERHRPPS